MGWLKVDQQQVSLMTVRLGQFSDSPEIQTLVTRALLNSDRGGDIDPGVLMQSISAALTLPQQSVWVSVTGGEIKGVVSGVIVPSFYGNFLTATDIMFYAEDASGYRLYLKFLAWADSFDKVEQVHFTNSFKMDVDDRKVDSMMKRLNFSATGRHYMKQLKHDMKVGT